MSIQPHHGFPMPALSYVETMGGEHEQSSRYVSDLDAAMRAAYDVHIKRVGDNIYPFIYVDFTLYGGRYTLVEASGTAHVRAPDLKHYEQLKSCAHVPLGIFVMIAEYARHSSNDQWIPAAGQYRDQIHTAIQHLDHIDGMTGHERQACRAVLQASERFLDNILQHKTFTLEQFRDYTKTIDGDLVVCAKRAAEIQVTALSRYVREFRSHLGSRWEQTYVVISGLWTLSVQNVHALIFAHHMSEQQRKTQLIVSEAVETIDQAKLLLGRIVGDRIAAQYVFNPAGNIDNQEDIYSLSTQRDLLSRYAHEALGDPVSGASSKAECPVTSAIAKGLSLAVEAGPMTPDK